MRVFFARHGESEANVLKVFANECEGYGLTELGRTQVEALAKSLDGRGIVHAIASPLLRAQQTAEIVCGHLGISFDTNSALREFSVGDHEGSCDKAAWDEYRLVETAWLRDGDKSARIGNGECYQDIENRFLPFMQMAEQRFGEVSGNLLLIGHGGTFACMLPLILDNVDRSFVMTHPIRPASLIEAVGKRGMFCCLSWCGIDLQEPCVEA